MFSKSWSKWTGLISSGVACLMIAGCQPAEETRTFSDEDNVRHEDEHAHVHGPHEGHIVELGGEDYHAEVTMDAESRKLTVYLLESDVKTPLPIEAESIFVMLKVGEETQELALSAQPEEGDAEGKSSRFQQAEGNLPESIHDAEDLQGEVVVEFGGTQYRGPITHDHDGEGHEGHNH